MRSRSPLEGRPVARSGASAATGACASRRSSEAEAALVEARRAGDAPSWTCRRSSGSRGCRRAGLASLVDAFRALVEREVFVHQAEHRMDRGSRDPQGGTLMNTRSRSPCSRPRSPESSPLPAALQSQDQKPAPDDGDKSRAGASTSARAPATAAPRAAATPAATARTPARARASCGSNPETCLKIQGGSLTKAAARSPRPRSEKKTRSGQALGRPTADGAAAARRPGRRSALCRLRSVLLIRAMTRSTAGRSSPSPPRRSSTARFAAARASDRRADLAKRSRPPASG